MTIFSPVVLVTLEELVTELRRALPENPFRALIFDTCRRMESKSEVEGKPLGRANLNYVKTLGEAFAYYARLKDQTPHFTERLERRTQKGLACSPLAVLRESLAEVLQHHPFLDMGYIFDHAQEAAVARLEKMGEKERSKVKRDFYDPLREKFFGRSEPAPKQEEKSESSEDLSDLFIPTFKHYEGVFGRYPYFRLILENDDPRLVVGYASFRHPSTNKLIRRNMKVTFPGQKPQTFKDLASFVGNLTDGNHRYIKVIRCPRGTVLKFWTHVQGAGDLEEFYRYFTVSYTSNSALGAISHPSEAAAIKASSPQLNLNL